MSVMTIQPLLTEDYPVFLWFCQPNNTEDKIAVCGQEGVLSIFSAAKVSAGIVLSDRKDYNYHKQSVRRCAFSPDGKHIAASCFDRELTIWAVDDPEKPICKLNAHEADVKGIAWHPIEDTLISTSRDKKGLVYTPQNDELTAFKVTGVLQGNTQDVKVVEFSEDGSVVCTGGYDNSLRMYAADHDNVWEELNSFSTDETVWDIVFNGDDIYAFATTFVYCVDYDLDLVWETAFEERVVAGCMYTNAANEKYLCCCHGSSISVINLKGEVVSVADVGSAQINCVRPYHNGVIISNDLGQLFYIENCE
ncbi:hypothetical protein PCE1_004557 [Barthelona sp. PCE]